MRELQSWTLHRLSRELGITRGRLDRVLRDQAVAPLQNGQRKLYGLGEVAAALCADTAAQAASTTHAGGLTEIERVRLERAQVNAERDRLQLEKERGELLPLAQIARQWADIVTAIRTSLLHVADRAAPAVYTLDSPSQVREVIDSYIREALHGIADGETVPGLESQQRAAGEADKMGADPARPESGKARRKATRSGRSGGDRAASGARKVATRGKRAARVTEGLAARGGRSRKRRGNVEALKGLVRPMGHRGKCPIRQDSAERGNAKLRWHHEDRLF